MMSNSDEYPTKLTNTEEEVDKLSLQIFKVESEYAEHCDSISQDEVKPSFSEKELEDDCVDPLNDNEEELLTSHFQGEYEDDDFLKESSNDESSELTEMPCRSKRAKVCREFKAPSGRVWSVNKAICKRASTTNSNIQLQPTGKGPARKAKNSLETWLLLMDNGILTTILTCTNEEIRNHKGKSAFEKPTDIIELRAWIGLNYLCGIFRNTAKPGPLSELWTFELGNSIFRATMTWKRFEFLTKCLRFSSMSSGKRKFKNSIHIEEIWQKFLTNCRSYYAPSGNCVVHEKTIQLYPDINSSHLTLLCDSKSLYVCNGLITQQTTNTRETHEQSILQLVVDIKGSNRNVTLPENYTSAEIVSKLLERSLTVVGSLPKESEEIPKTLLVKESAQKLYSDIGCIKRLAGEDAIFMLSCGLAGNVAIERLFELNKFSCKHFEEAIDTFSTIYALPDMPQNISLLIFHNIMNFAALNAWILLRLSASCDESSPTQREFQRDLGLYLTQMQLKRQLENKNKLTLTQKLQICEILGESNEKLLLKACEEAKKNSCEGFVPLEKIKLPEGLVLMSKTMERRQRCAICSIYHTRTRCQQCLRALCYRHLITRCNDCMGITNLPES
ncbi:uncharacterized protein LOC105217171 isoform X2 [Zeugodacus cucurbitae]|uniref:uncharacterized protein LOC105217171 isoform X2 n=1 Tax=Zeugodacus cucurbitae TaxID=28588 RepID=UPI0023D94DEC|nr:uncharacterized protein LOC105217171 isoform X2 [Zeugodacus cucurbitae]XP_011190354.2 uncharacterized protein LOC105217171 isoform X2 [Zeugodacus cucurbitae]XP_011190355.2 uncharacterized protein LOC105217171 isoform X2 [Zeugodacus cucurbitae]XP_054088786.1 uncharacterized protein LOC105217171 isoform X2 [Zeugodacus cucurbitae]